MLSAEEAAAAAAVWSIIEETVNERTRSIYRHLDEQLPKLVKKLLDEGKNN